MLKAYPSALALFPAVVDMTTPSNKNCLTKVISCWETYIQSAAIDGRLRLAATEALSLNGESAELERLISAIVLDDFSILPALRRLDPSGMNGAKGAYSAITRTIYLNREWLTLASLKDVVSVLNEEFGHHLDALLNELDTPGDEGEYFAQVLSGIELSETQKLRLRSENDSILIRDSGQLLLGEAALVHSSQIVVNGVAAVDLQHPTNRVALLSVPNGYGSAWWSQLIDLSQDWSTSFYVTAFNGNGTSDGFTFAINGDPVGLAAIGDGGQNLGFFGYESKVGVANSYAVLFDMWTTAPSSLLGFAASENNMIPQGNIELPIQLTNNAYQVSISYNSSAKILSVSIGGQTFQQSIDLSVVVGNSAILGFTAANGGGTMDTDISSWDVTGSSYSPLIPSLVVTSAVVDALEGNQSTKQFSFHIERKGDLGSESTVGWTVNGNGDSPATGSDFAGGLLPSGIVSFATGQAIQVIDIPVSGDLDIEFDETFVVTLSSPTGAILDPTGQSATATIVNDDFDNDSPIITAIAIQGSKLLVKFSEPVVTTGLLPARFSATVGSSSRSVTAVAGGSTSSQLLLTLSGAAPKSSQVVRLRYTDLAGDNTTGVIQDAAGNDMATIMEPGQAADSFISSATVTNLASTYSTLVLRGKGNVNGTGNTLANTVIGNNGSNILNGGAGNDTMSGGLGNDTYIVNTFGDVIQENVDSGIDTVRTSVTYTLADNVENLVLLGRSSISATGNALANTLTGNAAANTLNGGGGVDRLIGGAGNDTYVLDNSADRIIETATGGTDTARSMVSIVTLALNVEHLTLMGTADINGTGNSLANRLGGNSGSNILNGLVGNDTLTGGAGADTFRFSTRPNATTNRDRLTDFNPIEGDRIELENSVFTQLPASGTLVDAAFVIGAGAFFPQHRIIYNPGNGNLIYDSNGNASGGSTVIAILPTGLGSVLTATQFMVT